MSISTNYPTIKPSLLLDFANTKQLDPRITFTRASTATYYDGVTTAKDGENLVLYSQEFDNVAWSNTATTDSANTTTAPDGTTTADTLTALNDASSGTTRIEQINISYVTGQNYVFSIFVKNGTVNYLQLFFSSASHGLNAYANFDLTGAGALGTVGSATTATITASTNGFFRLTISAPCTSSVIAGVFVQMIASTTDARTASITRSGQTVILWGAQLEQRSSVTAYTPTTTQPITNYVPVLLTAAAGVPRFNHNPTTGESLGLLVEEQRTNLLTYSSEFDNAAWAKSNTTVTANTVIAPDGALTGDVVIQNTVNDFHGIYGAITVTSGTTYTWSVFAKAQAATVLQMTFGNTNSTFSGLGFANFNLSAGTVSATGGTLVGSGIQAVGNGWYRCFISATATATAATNNWLAIANSTNSARLAPYTGNGYSGIYIWGAQLEEGAFATSYIPTVAATVTRSADNASMTGTNFSSWYRPDEGVVYFESQTAQGAAACPYSLFGTSTTNRITATYLSSFRIEANIRVNSVFEALASTPNNTAPTNTFGKGAAAYKANDFGFSWNGAAALTDTATSIPTIVQFDIGNNGGLAGNFLNGTIKKIAYYPARLTNAQLQALTT